MTDDTPAKTSAAFKHGLRAHEHWQRRQPVGYRPQPGCGAPTLIFSANLPVGRLPAGRAIVFTSQGTRNHEGDD